MSRLRKVASTMTFNEYFKKEYDVDLDLNDLTQDGKADGSTTEKLWNYFSKLELEGTPVEYMVETVILDYLDEIK